MRLILFGEPGRIRTLDLVVRSHTLCPTELQVHNLVTVDRIELSLVAYETTVKTTCTVMVPMVGFEPTTS